MAFRDISETFDRVVVVNLARRPERLVRFHQAIQNDWPFKTPERFEAVDGTTAQIPAGWDKGPGAWGCLQSHWQIVHQAMVDKISSLLVLEDDAYPIPRFREYAAEFLSRVPDDWDCLMLGAEHLLVPEPVDHGVLRCRASNRTHCYAVRAKFMPTLLDIWRNTPNEHCDMAMAFVMSKYRFYCPYPLLIGQDSGQSDVTHRNERLRFLDGAEKEAIAVSDPRHLIERLIVRLPNVNDRVLSRYEKSMPRE